MRIVAGLLADELGNLDRDAAGGAGCRQQLGHPGIIVGAVVDDDPRRRETARRRGTRLEKVRILVRVGEDAGDFHSGAAHLLRDVAIEILGRYDGDRLRARCGDTAQADTQYEKSQDTHVSFPCR